MSESSGTEKNTSYGVFVQACWAQHTRQYPDQLIHKEIEEFNKQCSVWWYNLSEQERERFQEVADRSNAQQAADANQVYGIQQENHAGITSSADFRNGSSVGEIRSSEVENVSTTTTTSGAAQNGYNAQNGSNRTSAEGMQNYLSSFNYGDYNIQGDEGTGGGRAHPYSSNTMGAQAGHQVSGMGGQAQQRMVHNVNSAQKPNQKPIKDPNAPKKPLSAYFLFSQDERVKVKIENPEYSITDVAKELGRRWATIDPSLKQQYEQRYQAAKAIYDRENGGGKPQKKKKDPNAPKQPLSAYFLFSAEERNKIKEGSPNISICDVAKELGRRWADLDPTIKQKFQALAEDGRQKYDLDMASYRNGTFQHPVVASKQAVVQQRTEPLVSVQAGFQQRTEPVASVQAGFQQRTEPVASVQAGFQQRTEPVVAVNNRPSFQQAPAISEPVVAVTNRPTFQQAPAVSVQHADGLDMTSYRQETFQQVDGALEGAAYRPTTFPPQNDSSEQTSPNHPSPTPSPNYQTQAQEFLVTNGANYSLQ